MKVSRREFVSTASCAAAASLCATSLFSIRRQCFFREARISSHVAESRIELRAS